MGLREYFEELIPLIWLCVKLCENSLGPLYQSACRAGSQTLVFFKHVWITRGTCSCFDIGLLSARREHMRIDPIYGLGLSPWWVQNEKQIRQDPHLTIPYRVGLSVRNTENSDASPGPTASAVTHPVPLPDVFGSRVACDFSVNSLESQKEVGDFSAGRFCMVETPKNLGWALSGPGLVDRRVW